MKRQPFRDVHANVALAVRSRMMIVSVAAVFTLALQKLGISLGFGTELESIDWQMSKPPSHQSRL